MIKEINIINYETTDGSVFSDKDLALSHQNYLDLLPCGCCDGKGIIYEDAGYDCWGRREFWSNKCKVCNGTGKQGTDYEERKEYYEQYLKLKSEFE